MLKSSGLSSSASGLLGKLFGWIPIHPNMITALSVLFSAIGFLSFFCSVNPIGFPEADKIFQFCHGSQFAAGFAFFLLAFLLDAVDGAVARAKNLVSKKGAFLDGISDRLVELFVVLALFVTTTDIQIQLLLLVILFFGTCMTSFVKAYAEHSGIVDNETAKKMPGLLERAERSVLLLAAMLLMVLSLASWVLPLLALIAFLSFATFAQRVWIAIRI